MNVKGYEIEPGADLHYADLGYASGMSLALFLCVVFLFMLAVTGVAERFWLNEDES